ncbi:meiotic recombination protein REC8 homolog, partial [Grus americana]|uniref:meiotic recombination protein REC8 homolog n=1 Tax=Grus americana TaxID=9117 RepID=UPI0024084C61
MFYYPEVLQRHTGCFGTIWLAATCSSRLLRREYLGVDVPRACAAVTAFVIGRGGWEVPPPPAGAPPPRCSLYLAALLQLGLVRVLGRQWGWLLEEAAQVLGRLHRARPPANIDVSPPRRLQLVPDARALMAALELAPDPFFGVMGPGLPSPTELPELRLEELPPAEVPAPPGPPLTVSPEIITLREPELLVLPALEVGLPHGGERRGWGAAPRLWGGWGAAPRPCGALAQEELPEVTARELELLMEVEGELLPPVEEIPEVPAPPPPLPPRVPEEPTLPPPPPEAPPRRRRRPPLTDPQPQIPQAEFQAQLLRPHGHCRELVLLEPPPKRRRTPSELLRNPTCAWLPPELWGLWDRCARRPPPAPPAPPELPSEVEVPREALEPSLPALPPSGEAAVGQPWGGSGVAMGRLWVTVGCRRVAAGRYGSLGGCCGSPVLAVGQLQVAVGQLWVAVGQLWVTMGHCGVVVGRYGSLWGGCGLLWVTVGQLWVTMGHSVGHCGVAVGRLWVTVGQLWVTMGHCGVVMGRCGAAGGRYGSPAPEVSLEVIEEEARPPLLPPEERR